MGSAKKKYSRRKGANVNNRKRKKIEERTENILCRREVCVRLENIFHNAEVCSKYNLSVGFTVKVENVVVKDEQDFQETCKESFLKGFNLKKSAVQMQSLPNMHEPNNLSHTETKSKKKWNIQNIFHVQKITSESPIFKNNNINSFSDDLKSQKRKLTLIRSNSNPTLNIKKTKLDFENMINPSTYVDTADFSVNLNEVTPGFDTNTETIRKQNFLLNRERNKFNGVNSRHTICLKETASAIKQEVLNVELKVASNHKLFNDQFLQYENAESQPNVDSASALENSYLNKLSSDDMRRKLQEKRKKKFSNLVQIPNDGYSLISPNNPILFGSRGQEHGLVENKENSLEVNEEIVDFPSEIIYNDFTHEFTNHDFSFSTNDDSEDLDVTTVTKPNVDKAFLQNLPIHDVRHILHKKTQLNRYNSIFVLKNPTDLIADSHEHLNGEKRVCVSDQPADSFTPQLPINDIQHKLWPKEHVIDHIETKELEVESTGTIKYYNEKNEYDDNLPFLGFANKELHNLNCCQNTTKADICTPQTRLRQRVELDVQLNQCDNSNEKFCKEHPVDTGNSGEYSLNCHQNSTLVRIYSPQGKIMQKVIADNSQGERGNVIEEFEGSNIVEHLADIRKKQKYNLNCHQEITPVQRVEFNREDPVDVRNVDKHNLNYDQKTSPRQKSDLSKYFLVDIRNKKNHPETILPKKQIQTISSQREEVDIQQNECTNSIEDLGDSIIYVDNLNCHHETRLKRKVEADIQRNESDQEFIINIPSINGHLETERKANIKPRVLFRQSTEINTQKKQWNNNVNELKQPIINEHPIDSSITHNSYGNINSNTFKNTKPASNMIGGCISNEISSEPEENPGTAEETEPIPMTKELPAFNDFAMPKITIKADDFRKNLCETIVKDDAANSTRTFLRKESIKFSKPSLPDRLRPPSRKPATTVYPKFKIEDERDWISVCASTHLEDFLDTELDDISVTSNSDVGKVKGVPLEMRAFRDRSSWCQTSADKKLIEYNTYRRQPPYKSNTISLHIEKEKEVVPCRSEELINRNLENNAYDDTEPKSATLTLEKKRDISSWIQSSSPFATRDPEFNSVDYKIFPNERDNARTLSRLSPLVAMEKDNELGKRAQTKVNGNNSPLISNSSVLSTNSQRDYAAIALPSKPNRFKQHPESNSQVPTTGVFACFSKLCIPFFESKSCKFGEKCRKLHSVPSIFRCILLHLPLEEVDPALAFIGQSDALLSDLFPLIVERLRMLKENAHLIRIIDEIFIFNCFNKTPLVNQIVKALVLNIGSLANVVKDILLVYGNQRHVLSDILLTLVVNATGSLADNWPIIQQLVKYRNNLDFGVVGDMLQKCMDADPADKVLFANICSDILNGRSLELAKISPNFLSKFVQNLFNLDLTALAKQVIQTYNMDEGLFSKSEEKPHTHVNCDTELPSPDAPKPLFKTPPKGNSPFLSQEFNNLRRAILDKNIVVFTHMLLQCNATNGLETFVLCYIKTISENRKETRGFFLNVCYYIEKERLQDQCKDTVHVLALNTIVVLEQQQDYQAAAEVARMFLSSISRVLQKKVYNDCTNLYDYHIKHFFVIRIFIQCKMPREVFHVFKVINWTAIPRTNWKLNKFLEMLEEIIFFTLNADLHIAKDIIMCVIDNTWIHNKLDIWISLNTLLKKMLEQAHKEDLLSMLNSILSCWYRKINKDVLRSLLVGLFDQLTNDQRLKFYSVCAVIGMYKYIEGNEKTIVLYDDMHANEIYLTFHVFFSNIVWRNYPYTNLVIQIEKSFVNINGPPPDPSMTYAAIRTVKHVFEKKFNLSAHFMHLSPASILLNYENISKCLSLYL